MCEKHSFVQDRQGKIYNGGGFEESHTMICAMHNLDRDKVNAYEWQPPEDWPEGDPLSGLMQDRIIFDEKQTHLDKISKYIKNLFPTEEAFDTYFIDEQWHGKEIHTSIGIATLVLNSDPITIEGAKMALIRGKNCNVTATGEVKVYGEGGGTITLMDFAQCDVRGDYTINAEDSAHVLAIGECVIHASDNASVEAYRKCIVKADSYVRIDAFDSTFVKAVGGVNVGAYGNSLILAAGNSRTIAGDNSTVIAKDSAIVEKLRKDWGNNSPRIALTGNAVFLDRTKPHTPPVFKVAA